MSGSVHHFDEARLASYLETRIEGFQGPISAEQFAGGQSGRIFWDPSLPELEKDQRGPLFEELIRILAAMHDVDINAVGLADDGQVSLIHGDYRLDNIIFDPDKPEALAVLDWELSTLGHPMADLAYFCMCLGVPTETGIVARYCELRGIERIGHWTFYLAFSFFRLAAIAQGVSKRALDGNASSEKAQQVGNMTPVLAQLAMNMITEEQL